MSIGYSWAAAVPEASKDRHAVKDSYQKEWEGYLDIKTKVEDAISVAKSRKSDVVALELHHICGASARFEELAQWLKSNNLNYTFGIDPETGHQLIIIAPE